MKQTSLSVSHVQSRMPNLSHGQSCVFLGSCFSDELGQIVRGHGFESLVNPGGTIFHPLALAKLLRWCFEEQKSLRTFQEDDLFFSWDLAGTVFGMSENELQEKIVKLRLDLKQSLLTASHVFVTFGTAWAYRLKTDDEIVANCHKQASTLFDKEDSSVDELVFHWQEIAFLLKEVNPSVQLIFTVSPVRHLKDGFIENNRSKARLLLAVEALTKIDQVHYFPAYEFVIDQLRDYQYFKPDGVHPNELAIQALWQFFQDCFFQEETKKLIQEWWSIRQAEQHKIMYPKSQAARKHLESTMKRKAQFLAAHPMFFLP
ncbi:MAG: GSCFA domain-containing protein [Flavobacteriales bacterium]